MLQRSNDGMRRGKQASISGSSSYGARNATAKSWAKSLWRRIRRVSSHGLAGTLPCRLMVAIPTGYVTVPVTYGLASFSGDGGLC